MHFNRILKMHFLIQLVFPGLDIFRHQYSILLCIQNEFERKLPLDGTDNKLSEYRRRSRLCCRGARGGAAPLVDYQIIELAEQ